jgi:hypothetical protein
MARLDVTPPTAIGGDFRRMESSPTANFADFDCELFPDRPENGSMSERWPDGGVVTQRTANPLPPLRKAPKFASFPVCSKRGLRWGETAGCELFGSVA